ncbi:DUF3080 family protein [Halomonas piscis]|uniref:DUF3080 family protein n=1 Tax=Halomonas piscis TaxID=3031727 RepID=A0ABY9YWR2_9GAMM|nr:DUF3080 family protein [Halomonas piscis]WNK19211.1 DUF3080 family protein [Halomonas piscis]
MPRRPVRRLAAAPAIALLLAGCGDSGVEQRWADYHRALEQSLDTAPIVRSSPTNISKLPRRRDRLFDIEDTREGILDVYALRKCRIVSLVAGRNNQLGRVAPPSQQWLYERKLWQRLSGCWNTPVPDGLADDDRQRLRRLTLTKTRQLPYVSWNALFDSEEWEKSFARASHAIDFSQANIAPDLAALDYLTAMVRHQFSREWVPDSGRLEQQLKTLRSRPLTAQTLRTLMLAAQRLDEATAALRQAPSGHCLPSRQPPALDATRKKAGQWLSAVNALFESLPVTPPPAMKSYRRRWLSLDNPKAPWASFQAALNEHHAERLRFQPCPDE